MKSLTRVPTVRQVRDCAHSREPFDQLFAGIQARRDLTGNPKRLYAALLSADRLGARWTHEQLAARLGACARSIVRWTQRLVEAGLLRVRRWGQGQPNEYEIIGRCDNQAPSGVPVRQAPRVDTYKEERKGPRTGYFHPFYGTANVHAPGT